MEQSDWSTFSPNNHKSSHAPYFRDLNEHIHEIGHNEGTSIINNQSNTPSNFTDSDHVFLHQLEHNLYETASTHSSSNNNDSNHNIPTPTTNNIIANQSNEHGHYEFGIENINFILPEDLNFESSHPQSSAFPPSSIPPQTPSILASNKGLSAVQTEPNTKAFVSPILPGQNERSYNNQHYYHKHNKSHRNSDTLQHQPPNQHVRPDAVFSPLVSPAVTPLDSQVNINKSQFNPPIQTSFEPLTSPALNAQRPHTSKRRTSSAVFAPPDDQISSHKRRTPHSTPNLQPNNNRVKQSPSLKDRISHRSPATVLPFEKLPESSIESSRNSSESTPMLPPQGKKVDITSHTNGAPATLMGFTMGKLAEQQLEETTNNSSSSAASSSRSSRKSSTYSNNSKILPKLSSSEETSPALVTQKSNTTAKPKSEKPATKKASHKLAEQGRRNRMNMAVHELGRLIPQSYHDEVAIPSKATTVELASKYISALLKEIEDLKNQ